MCTNVVVAVVDALRADRIGVYRGRERELESLTPNIDALAAEGTVFANAYTVSNTTDPAMTTLQTGRYPASHGVHNHGHRVTDTEKRRVERVPMLAQPLADAGFETIKTGRPLGRWHSRGFQTYPEIERRSPKVRAYQRLESIDPRLTDVGSYVYGLLEPAVQTITEVRDWAGDVHDRLESESREEDGPDAIDELLSEVTTDRPFFGLVHLMDTHAPYTPDEALVDSLLERNEYDGEPLEELFERFDADTITGNKLRNLHDEGVTNTARLEARYDATVSEADRKIGRLVDGLKRRDLFEETLFFLLADHGESLDEHGIYFDHHGLYDCTVRIPLLVAGPGVRDDTRDEFVQLTDVVPTILEELGIEPDVPVDGESLRPLLAGDETEWTDRDAVIAEEYHTQSRRMIRTATHKYVWLTDGEPTCRYCEVAHASEEELYDLRADPTETENLLTDDGDRERRDTLRDEAEKLFAKYEREPDANANERRIDYDDEEAIVERLDELGYR